MNQYFSKITADHWLPKNNLEKAAKNLAYEMDGILIDQEKVQSFLQEFKRRINELNEKFNRCKPLDYSAHKSYDNKNEWWIYCNGVFHMSIYNVKQVYL